MKTRWCLGGLMILLSAFLFSCKKYLDAKPDKSLVIPSTLPDYQALLDNNSILNQQSPLCGEGSADNYYLTDDSYNALYSQAYRNIYTWGDEINFDLSPGDWEINYDQVYLANVVLEGLNRLPQTAANAGEWNNVKGQALFFRANAFLKVALCWAKAYDSTTADTDLGIPLRLQQSFAIPSTRSNLQDTYGQILDDLKESVALLPVQPLVRMRPSRPAGYALLARTCLTMHDYTHALLYADSCLQLKDNLMDYNGIDSNAYYPFAQDNAEVIMNTIGSNVLLDESTAKVDTLLYRSYEKGDLRKALFFRDNGDGTFGLRGTYWGNYGLFTGIATDEVYLTKAECEIRTGHAEEGMKTLNVLLQKRFAEGEFVPYQADNNTLALQQVLAERRKELPFRDLRWMDIKRLNAEGAGIVLQRVVQGNVYTLKPNENRYALPIPRTVIQLTGMVQNPR